MPKPKILAFSGSTRRESFNRQLLAITATAAREAGADVTHIDLDDFPLPIYDQDLEHASGHPENALKLKELFLQHQGLLLACPEYNSSVTPLWKNTIDWVSRPDKTHPALAAYNDKTAVIMAASPGALGGLRGLVHVRSILANIGVLVLPEQIALGSASSAFDGTGNLADPKQHAKARDLGKLLATVLTKLHA
jgi:NAD(P)H-dependent FMN reductase